MDAKTRDVLVGVKTELSKGWTQGSLEDEKGVCIYGALFEAAHISSTPAFPGSPCRGTGFVKGRGEEGPAPGEIAVSWTFQLESPAGKAVKAICAEVGVDDPLDLALWNDAEGRTVDEIVAAIDRILVKDEVAPGRIKLLKASKGSEKIPVEV